MRMIPAPSTPSVCGSTSPCGVGPYQTCTSRMLSASLVGLPALRLAVFLQCHLEQIAARGMESDHTFWLHEPRRGLTAFCSQSQHGERYWIIQTDALRENRHDMTA